MNNCRLQQGRFRSGRSLKTKTKKFFVPFTGSSIFLQETSCRTFRRAIFDFGRESKAWNLLVMPTSIHVSIPHPFPSSFPPHCASFMKTMFSTGSFEFLQETSCRTFGRTKFNFKRESDGGNLLVRSASTSVSIPRLSPSFFHLIVLLQEVLVEIVGS